MITAADIVKKHGHGLAWFQTHYGAQHLGHAGQYLFILALIALAGLLALGAVSRATRSDSR